MGILVKHKGTTIVNANVKAMDWKKTIRENVDYIFGGVNVVMGFLVLANTLATVYDPQDHKDTSAAKEKWPKQVFIATKVCIFLLFLFLAVLWILSGKAKAGTP